MVHSRLKLCCLGLSYLDKSRVAGTELFALDVDLAIQLLSALDGRQIYPKPSEKSKEEMFEEATGNLESKVIPDGLYYLSKKIKRFDNKTVNSTMRVKNGSITVLKGSDFCPVDGTGCHSSISDRRKKAKTKDNKLKKDEHFNSVSLAAAFIIGTSSNGWLEWKTEDGKVIDKFRKKDVE